jgi:hypothetical protein
MAKYINSEKFKIVFLNNKDLTHLNPGEKFETKEFIPELSKYLVHEPVEPKPVNKVIKKSTKGDK